MSLPIWKIQEFRVQAHITFVAVPGRILNPDLLKASLLAAEAVDPWQSFDAGGKPLPSLRFRNLLPSTGRKMSEVDPPSMVETSLFTIEPSGELSASQLSAYYESVSSLVGRIVESRPSDVCSVGFLVRFLTRHAEIPVEQGPSVE